MTGEFPGEFTDWRLSLANDTLAMQHERDMVRSFLGRSGLPFGFRIQRSADLNEIAHPTLMIYGTADVTGSVELWRHVMGAMPHGELQVMDGAGPPALVRGQLASSQRRWARLLAPSTDGSVDRPSA